MTHMVRQLDQLKGMPLEIHIVSLMKRMGKI
jgi:hypothetical protein